MNITKFAIIVLSIFLMECGYAQIYQWIDDDGNVYYSDKPRGDLNAPGDAKNVGTDKKSGLPAGKENALGDPGSDTAVFRVSEGAKGNLTLTVRELFLNQRFSQLGELLHQLQTDAWVDISAEERLYTAYSAFGDNDKSYEGLFDLWMTAVPDSYLLLTARAHYYYSMGWYARGGSWASETKKERFEEMSRYFDYSVRDAV